MRESELVARRVVLWSLGAVGLCLGFAYLHIGFGPEQTAGLLGGKLAFLGLVVAAGAVEHAALRRSAAAVAWPVAGVLRYHRAVLGNYVFIGLALLISCGLDALALLATVDIAGWRHVSAGLLAVTAAPFGEALVRQVEGVGGALDAARRQAALARRGRLD